MEPRSHLLRWIGLLNAVFLSLIVLVFGYILAETIFDVRPTRKMKNRMSNRIKAAVRRPSLNFQKDLAWPVG